jgi:pimeloyl-ACP methyl ester carboxylesterase
MSVEFLTLAEGAIAYQRQIGDPARPGIIFLAGYTSDMNASKACFLAKKCLENSLQFVRFDYYGCGQSSGNFKDGTIGKWLNNSLAILDQICVGPQIIVGSSMGGWLGLIVARERAARTRAFIGIAAAPDFTEDLLWAKLSEEQKKKLSADKQIFNDTTAADHRLPVTLDLVTEARSHLIFRSSFHLDCPVRLLQGLNDQEVPPHYAQRIIDHLKNSDAKITYIENGDHRLSSEDNLHVLWQTVAEFL